MNEQQHTPLPWVLGKVGDVGYSKTVAPCQIWTEKGPGNGMVATTAPFCEPYEQQRIDAAFIVRAANSHYALVVALRDLLTAAHAYGRAVSDSEQKKFNAAWDAAQAVLTEATGARHRVR